MQDNSALHKFYIQHRLAHSSWCAKYLIRIAPYRKKMIAKKCNINLQISHLSLSIIYISPRAANTGFFNIFILSKTKQLEIYSHTKPNKIDCKAAGAADP
jgi:hypothetical protein